MNFTEGARDQDGTKYKLTSTTAVNVKRLRNRYRSSYSQQGLVVRYDDRMIDISLN